MKCQNCGHQTEPYRTAASLDDDNEEIKQYKKEIETLKSKLAAAKKENSIIQKLKKINWDYCWLVLLVIPIFFAHSCYKNTVNPPKPDYCYIRNNWLYIHNPIWYNPDETILNNSSIEQMEEYAKKYSCELRLK